MYVEFPVSGMYQYRRKIPMVWEELPSELYVKSIKNCAVHCYEQWQAIYTLTISSNRNFYAIVTKFGEREPVLVDPVMVSGGALTHADLNDLSIWEDTCWKNFQIFLEENPPKVIDRYNYVMRSHLMLPRQLWGTKEVLVGHQNVVQSKKYLKAIDGHKWIELYISEEDNSSWAVLIKTANNLFCERIFVETNRLQGTVEVHYFEPHLPPKAKEHLNWYRRQWCEKRG